MLAHARAAHARLRETFPEGFALNASHAPHLTMLIQYVRTAGLDAVGAAAMAVFEDEHPARWTLTAAGGNDQPVIVSVQALDDHAYRVRTGLSQNLGTTPAGRTRRRIPRS
jgi:hypothetical protein